MSNRPSENPIRKRRFLLLGGCTLLLLTLGAEKPAPGNVLLEIRGYIVPVRQVTVSPKVAGQVLSLSFEEGQKVKEGDVLARLDSAKYEGVLRLERARLKLAEAHVAKAKGGTRPDFDIAQAEVEVAKARVEIAAHRLDCTTIRAPVSGTVLVKKVEVGSMIDPVGSTQVSAGLCDIADLKALDVELSVPERDIALIDKQQKCLVRFPGDPRTTYKGHVSRILPVADRAKACVGIRVRVEVPAGDDRLRPELGVTVQILRKE